MIHRVIAAVDAGAVVVKREILFVDPEDNEFAVFEAKVHKIEWELVVDGVRKMVDEIEQTERNQPAVP